MNNQDINHVFVYGTLKRGLKNHALLKDSYCLGQFKTLDSIWEMVDCIRFPGVIRVAPRYHKAGDIVGELYEVSSETLSKLDFLESNGKFYTRILVSLEGCSVPAWMYTLPNKKEFSKLAMTMTNKKEKLYSWA